MRNNRPQNTVWRQLGPPRLMLEVLCVQVGSNSPNIDHLCNLNKTFRVLWKGFVRSGGMGGRVETGEGFLLILAERISFLLSSTFILRMRSGWEGGREGGKEGGSVSGGCIIVIDL